MKPYLSLITLLIACFFNTPLQAADKDTLFKGEIRHSGYCEMSIKVTQLDNISTNLTGFSCAWLMNERLYFGASVHGNLNQITGIGSMYHQGGFLLGYNLNPHRMWHFSSELFVGTSSLTSISSFNYTVLEPSVTLNLNLTKFAKLRLGTGYRWIHGSSGGFGPAELQDTVLFFGLQINPFEITYPKIKTQEI